MSAAVLIRLDGYMAAAGYDTDHPWRSEIATALAPSTSTITTVNALTPDEVRLIAEFRSMNQWARHLLRDLADGYAADFPAPNCGPIPPLTEAQPQEVTS